jgi:hypothetical protein
MTISTLPRCRSRSCRRASTLLCHGLPHNRLAPGASPLPPAAEIGITSRVRAPPHVRSYKPLAAAASPLISMLLGDCRIAPLPGAVGLLGRAQTNRRAYLSGGLSHQRTHAPICATALLPAVATGDWGAGLHSHPGEKPLWRSTGAAAIDQYSAASHGPLSSVQPLGGADLP